MIILMLRLVGDPDIPNISAHSITVKTMNTENYSQGIPVIELGDQSRGRFIAPPTVICWGPSSPSP
jgi:hypothetical protein